MSDPAPADEPAPLVDHFATIADEADSKTGPIQKINMIRFKDQAQYAEGQQPDGGSSSGREAHARYGELAGPFVAPT